MVVEVKERGLGREGWEVPVAGSGVRLRGLDFFSLGFRGYICSEGKNDEKNPHPPTSGRPYEGRRGIWLRVKYLYLLGGSFAAGMRL